VYGTVTTPHRFSPNGRPRAALRRASLRAVCGRKPTIQDVRPAGLLTRETLPRSDAELRRLERDSSSGRIIRKLCRYQQYVAVNKARAACSPAKKATDRGGVGLAHPGIGQGA